MAKESRVEQILMALNAGETWSGTPQSRVESLLMLLSNIDAGVIEELKEILNEHIGGSDEFHGTLQQQLDLVEQAIQELKEKFKDEDGNGIPDDIDQQLAEIREAISKLPEESEDVGQGINLLPMFYNGSTSFWQYGYFSTNSENGTGIMSSSKENPYLCPVRHLTEKDDGISPGKAYTLSTDAPFGSNFSIEVVCKNDSEVLDVFYLNAGENILHFITPERTNQLGINVRSNMFAATGLSKFKFNVLASFKIKLEEGTIDHPIWTPNPNDILVKSIYPKETNIDWLANLLPSSADFWEYGYYKGDIKGSGYGNSLRSKDHIQNLIPGEMYTFSREELEGYTPSIRFDFYRYSTYDAIDYVTISGTTLRSSFRIPEEAQSVGITITEDAFLSDSYTSQDASLEKALSVLQTFKLKLERGDVIDPVWTPYASEIASVYDIPELTDDAVGMNLLSILPENWSDASYSGGPPALHTILTDIPAKPDTEYTLSLQDYLDITQGDSVSIIGFYHPDEAPEGTLVVDYSTGLNFSETKSVVHRTTSRTLYIMIAFSYRGQPITYERLLELKPKLEEGAVENPIWTPHPNDVALKSDIPEPGSDVELTKESIVEALGYEPPVNDTQGVNLYRNGKDERAFSRNTYIDTYDILSDYVDKTITVSFDMKINSDGVDKREFLLYAYQSNGISIDKDQGNAYRFTPSKDYQRFEFVCKVKNWGDLVPTYSKGQIIIWDYTGVNRATIKNIKIELGAVTEPIWTPAPQDLLTKTEFEETLDEAMSEVVTKDTVIGGRNYLLSPYNDEVTPINTNVSWTYDRLTGMFEITVIGKNNNVQQAYFKDAIHDINEVKGKRITLSVSDFYCSDESLYTRVICVFTTGKGVTTPVSGTKELFIGNKDNNGAKSLTYDVPDLEDIQSFYYMFRVDQNRSADVGTVMRGRIKLEIGEVVTDWTPAPEDFENDILDTPEMHRNIFRGKNLGSEFTNAQKLAIKNGTFEDLYVGDYWVINNVTWRIADIDYWWNTGSTVCRTHHLVVVPDKNISPTEGYTMNDESTTSTGYAGSKMYTDILQEAIATIERAFGNTLLNHSEYLVNAVTNGQPSGAAWFDSKVELMNEIMVYGCHIYASANTGEATKEMGTIDNSQLSLFNLCKEMIIINRNTGGGYWLRDIVSASDFSCVSVYGRAHANRANSLYGLRPVFGITGEGAVEATVSSSDQMQEELSLEEFE